MASMALNRSNMKEEARLSYKRSMQESLQNKDESGLEQILGSIFFALGQYWMGSINHQAYALSTQSNKCTAVDEYRQHHELIHEDAMN